MALEDRKGRNGFSIEPLEGIQPCCHFDILISEVQDCKIVFFNATKFVVICYSDNEEVIQYYYVQNCKIYQNHARIDWLKL